MPSTGIGVYAGSATAVENDEVSSTYEGRHLTFLEADITGHEHAFPTKGHPVVVGEHIVGVVLGITRTDGSIGAAANAVTDMVTIDTEGIWNLSVVASNDAGNSAVVAGDAIYINTTTAILSKIVNGVTQRFFGYALGGIAGGSTFVIAVKVHFELTSMETKREYYTVTSGAYTYGKHYTSVFADYAGRFVDIKLVSSYYSNSA